MSWGYRVCVHSWDSAYGRSWQNKVLVWEKQPCLWKLGISIATVPSGEDREAGKQGNETEGGITDFTKLFWKDPFWQFLNFPTNIIVRFPSCSPRCWLSDSSSVSLLFTLQYHFPACSDSPALTMCTFSFDKCTDLKRTFTLAVNIKMCCQIQLTPAQGPITSIFYEKPTSTTLDSLCICSFVSQDLTALWPL